MSTGHVLSPSFVAGKAAAAVRRAPSRPMRSPSTGGVEVPFSAHFHLVRTGRHPGGKLVEGLRMSWNGEPEDQRFSHLPVMVAEVVELFAPVPPGVVLDATVGGGGHASAILDRLPDLSVVGLDQDPIADPGGDDGAGTLRAPGSTWCTPASIVWMRPLTAWASIGSRAPSSTSASALRSSIDPSGDSAIGPTRPSTCAWTPVSR